jgi:hypothetical protein
MSPHPGTVEKIITNPLPRPRERRGPDFFALADEIYKVIQ